MDLSSILSLLEKANINTNEVQDLIYEASRLDLSKRREYHLIYLAY